MMGTSLFLILSYANSIVLFTFFFLFLSSFYSPSPPSRLYLFSSLMLISVAKSCEKEITKIKIMLIYLFSSVQCPPPLSFFKRVTKCESNSEWVDTGLVWNSTFPTPFFVKLYFVLWDILANLVYFTLSISTTGISFFFSFFFMPCPF